MVALTPLITFALATLASAQSFTTLPSNQKPTLTRWHGTGYPHNPAHPTHFPKGTGWRDNKPCATGTGTGEAYPTGTGTATGGGARYKWHPPSGFGRDYGYGRPTARKGWW